MVTSKKFNVPKSTVGGWVMKAHKAGYSNRSSEGTSVAEGEQLLVDIPSISDHCVGTQSVLRRRWTGFVNSPAGQLLLISF